MQFLFRVILLFLIVFNFRVPIFYNSSFVSIFLCTIYYINKRNTIPFTYFYQRYNAAILLATVTLAFLVFLIAFLHNTEIASSREKRMWVEFMMLWAVVYVLPLLIEGKESNALNELALLICYAYAIQGAISLAGYLYAPFGNLLISIKPQELQTAYTEATISNRFRFLNLSGVFLVELTASFGVAFIAFFWLQLKSNHFYMIGWKKYAVFFFIFMGTVFSGRTGFIGLVMGIAGWLYFSIDRVLLFLQRNMKYIIASVLVLFITYNFVLSGRQRQSFNNEVFPFAFEWYYNYMDYGKFEVGSAEATSEHYYYLSDETLLKGHGIDAFGGKSPYPHSDAGYMNTLVYGGIPLLVFLIFYQCLYSARPMAIALKTNSRKSRINLGFFLLLFLYIFIVEIKAPAVGFLHAVEVMYLALGSAYVIQYSFQREKGELTE